MIVNSTKQWTCTIFTYLSHCCFAVAIFFLFHIFAKGLLPNYKRTRNESWWLLLDSVFTRERQANLPFYFPVRSVNHYRFWGDRENSQDCVLWIFRLIFEFFFQRFFSSVFFCVFSFIFRCQFSFTVFFL